MLPKGLFATEAVNPEAESLELQESGSHDAEQHENGKDAGEEYRPSELSLVPREHVRIAATKRTGNELDIVYEVLRPREPSAYLYVRISLKERALHTAHVALPKNKDDREDSRIRNCRANDDIAHVLSIADTQDLVRRQRIKTIR